MSGASASPLAALAHQLTSAAEAGADRVPLRVLDTVSAFAVGAGTEEGTALTRLEDQLAMAPDGAAWSRGRLDDVLVRVATTRLTECDDIHPRSGTTPGSVVVPVAVSLGAAAGAKPAEFGLAVAGGYEAMARLGLAAGGPRVADRGIWPTYLGAGFAAAAVAAVLLGLDPDRTAHALGIALTRAAWVGTVPPGAPIARWLTVGDAARSGCLAALAAAGGFRGQLDLDRFAAATGIALDDAALATPAAALAEASVKPFPAAKQMVAALEAARRLGDRVRPAAIRAIRLYVPEPYLGVIGRDARTDSRLSRVSGARWNLALALARPAGLADVERAAPPLDDPELGRLARLVEIRTDDDLLAHYPRRWPARVVIETDGGTLDELVVDAPGDPGGDKPLEELVERKWRRLAGAPGADELQTAARDVMTPGGPRRLDDAMRRFVASPGAAGGGAPATTATASGPTATARGATPTAMGA